MTWHNLGIRSTCLISLILFLSLTSPIIHSAGVNWTLKNTGSTENLLDIISNGSIYVVIGSNGTILTSPDTTAWTNQTSNVTNELRSIIWDGTQFVIAGEGGMVLTSPDGITWTTRTTGVTYRLNNIVWNGALFVAAGQKSQTINTDNPNTGAVETSTILTGAILTSPDAITWTEQDSDLDTDPVIYAPPSRIQDIIWDGTQFVAVAAQRIYWDETLLQFVSTDDGAIITSTDAVTWVGQTSGTNNALLAITRNNSLLAAVGAKGTILTSTDGQTWTIAISGTKYTLSSISWNGAVFVAVGEAGTIVTSVDGTNWTTQTSGTSNWLHSVYWDGTQFNIAGTNDTILTSTGNDPDLSVSGSLSPSSVVEGDAMTYTLTVTNIGAATATGVTLGSILPSSVEISSITTGAGSCSESNNTITCDIGSIAINGSTTITINTLLSASGTLTNSVIVVANEAEPNLVDNSLAVSTTAGSALDLDVPSTTTTTTDGGGSLGLWFVAMMGFWGVVVIRRCS